MIRLPPRSTQSRSSAASDVYKRQDLGLREGLSMKVPLDVSQTIIGDIGAAVDAITPRLSLIHISEPTRPY